MKKFLSLFSLLLIVAIAACQQPGGKAQNQTIPADQFEKVLADNKEAQLIDVRTEEEFKSGHIAGAKNLDFYKEDFKDALSRLDKKKPVMLYCKSGGRSGQAADMLAQMGFEEVYNLQGGMMAWSNANKPVDMAGAAPKTAGMNEADYLKLVASKPLVLVDFNATWCMPCKKLAPILEEIEKKENGRLTLIKIDTDENPELIKAKKLDGIPYLELYKDGKLVWSNMGLTDEATITARLK